MLASLKINRTEKYFLVGLIVAWLLVHVFLIRHYGFRELYDAVQYVQGADYLLEHNRLEDSDDFFYLGTIGFIAIFRWAFPGELMPFILAQCIISGFAMLSLSLASAKIFHNKLAGFITGLLFLLWWDNIHWNTTTMTESLACSVTCFIVYGLTFFKNTVKEYVVIGLLLIFMFFVRPTGILTIAGTAIFFFRYHWSTLRSKPVLKFAIFCTFILISITGAYLMFSRWDFTEQLKEGSIVTYMNRNEGTPLYEEGLHLPSNDIEQGNPSLHPILKIASYIFHNPLHFAKTASLKIWYLVSFYRPYYSHAHNLYSMSWAFFVYVLFYFGFRNAAHPIKAFAITVIVVNCALIGIATVDWDNRFFIPMEPGIVLLAGGGGAYIFKKISSFLKDRKQVSL